MQEAIPARVPAGFPADYPDNHCIFSVLHLLRVYSAVAVFPGGSSWIQGNRIISQNDAEPQMSPAPETPGWR